MTSKNLRLPISQVHFVKKTACLGRFSQKAFVFVYNRINKLTGYGKERCRDRTLLSATICRIKYK